MKHRNKRTPKELIVSSIKTFKVPEISWVVVAHYTAKAERGKSLVTLRPFRSADRATSRTARARNPLEKIDKPEKYSRNYNR